MQCRILVTTRIQFTLAPVPYAVEDFTYELFWAANNNLKASKAGVPSSVSSPRIASLVKHAIPTKQVANLNCLGLEPIQKVFVAAPSKVLSLFFI